MGLDQEHANGHQNGEAKKLAETDVRLAPPVNP
jgi:hypothetical protein